ncbi:MAG: AAA family ATPase [Phycisphaeraceae bacterium]|nr:MAG: AAA family ATPase [Phycisphaeraceae bacterium]
MSIHAGDDGRALLHCHAGCESPDVLESIGLQAADLFADDPRQTARRNGHGPPRKKAPDARTREGANQTEKVYATARDAVAELERRHGPRSTTWTYHDAGGEPVGLVVRWNTPTGKDVRPVSKTPAGWIIGGMPTPRPLYALPDLLATKPGDRVYVAEGEKAADAARAVGLVATTSPHGSKSAGKADWSPVSGREVVILPDHDDAGERYAADVARLATAAGAKSVRVVRLVELWAGMPEGGDMADLVEHRGGDVTGGAIRAEVEALTPKPAPTTPKPAPIDGGPVVVRLSDVQPEPVAWLWPGRFALGKLTLIAGDPGLGKSFLTLDMASRVSTGAGWPDHRGERITPGGVVLLSAEDAIADTIRPRLDAAGADVARIVALEAIRSVGDNGRESARAFDLSRDLPALEAAIRSVEGCRLVVIDPVTAYLGGVDSHKNGEIRGLLAPLGAIAERHRVAVVAVTHLNKSAGGPAIYRAMGSLAFAAAARAAWAVAKDRDDPRRRLLLPIKNNIAPDTGGLAYRIEPLGVDGCPAVAWEPDPVNVSADDALAGDRDDGGGRTERDDAAEWLADLLAHGPRAARDVERDARDAGYSIATVRRAKAAIGVVSRKPAFGGPWEWTLPAQDAQPPKMLTEDAHTPASEHLGEKHAGFDGNPSKMLNGEGVSALGDGERLGDTATDAGDGWGEL